MKYESQSGFYAEHSVSLLIAAYLVPISGHNLGDLNTVVIEWDELWIMSSLTNYLNNLMICVWFCDDHHFE